MVAAFGRQLKLLRVRAGQDRAAFGKLVGYAAESVASIEQGRRIPQPRFIERADEVVGAGGVLVALKEELARAQYPAFFRDAARFEAKAMALNVHAMYAVPGLLQTEEYARAVFHLQRPLLQDEIVVGVPRATDGRGMSAQRTKAAVPEAAWFKSSYSTGNGGECLEVARSLETVLIRDSKRLAGPVLAVGADAWAGFVRLASGR
ncbi:Scr1 family TA system antitoxin-like transcriptional regulator [Streptomyces sp. NPDC059785]|uniref:Scr1 family TA system antitoxin-like transcriptional regulator n=1 Tax=Streptomyces sp. NPDC059785 TaxID=3346945 RepID=UPI0036462D8B